MTPVAGSARSVVTATSRASGFSAGPSLQTSTASSRRAWLAVRTEPLGHVDAAAAERVDPTPAAGDVEQLEMADLLWQHRIDDEVLALRLEAEHRAEQQERCSRGPG